jgi:starch synthase
MSAQPAIRVLFASSEVFPLIKTGGLADVSYALPKALHALGLDVRVLLPAYSSVKAQLSWVKTDIKIPLFSFLHQQSAIILEARLPDSDVPLYLLDCPMLYQREGGPYQDGMGNDWADNALRFGLLSRAAALFGEHQFDFKPDIVHCNDWQTGLTPAYLHYSPRSQAKTLISLHNVAYQGVFGSEVMGLLELPPASFGMYGLEYYGLVSFLKAGIYYSNWITTVSPTYALEIQTPTFGYGLAGLLAGKKQQLTGILNGIDDHWNPHTDPYLAQNYDFSDQLKQDKFANKKALCDRVGLSAEINTPLIGLIGRLTYQKGIDLILPVLDQILAEKVQVVLLGSGDKGMEQQLQALASRYPQQLRVTLGYDESLAHQIEAGADLFLMPSRFEPCGLNQLYSMRYGTLPIVRHTGGLADTVTDVTPRHLDAGSANGFVFAEETPEALLQTVRRALVLYRCPELWHTLQRHGMQRDLTWAGRATEYIQLYQQLIETD